MNSVGRFYMPDDTILRELGRLQVLHSQMDHMLRLSIKRMLGISINDPGYWTETRGMTASLRDRVRDLISERYRHDDDTAGILNKILDDAEEVTGLRNRALHSVWMQEPGKPPVLHDRVNWLKTHVNYQLPTAAELTGISARIARIQGALDNVTRQTS